MDVEVKVGLLISIKKHNITKTDICQLTNIIFEKLRIRALSWKRGLVIWLLTNFISFFSVLF